MKNKDVKRINIDEIKDPSFLKDLNNDQLNLLCSDLREYLLKCVSKNGGHLASNLGVVEATVALCKVFDFTKDKLIFDVGHQCYVYKILTGRKLDKLRQKDGISGFQKISESPYDCYEAGHSSTSISAATGMAAIRDLNKEKFDVIAFIGDASIANGVALEALNDLSESGHKVIIVLNDNEMSIAKPVGGLSKAFRKFSNSNFYNRNKNRFNKVTRRNSFGRWIHNVLSKIKNWIKRHLVSLNIFDNFDIGYLGPVDGHNIKELEKAFKRAKSENESIVIHIKTKKGKGYSFAENDSSGQWHGVGKFNIETGEISCDSSKISWSEQYCDEIIDVMNENKNIFTIVPATGLGSSLGPVEKYFPTRFIDVGIAEEHALILSSGISVSGYHPIISIYSTFLQRGYDEISHDLARMNLNATLLIDRAGLTGNDGDTHQGIYDEQFLYGIPNTVITMASNPSQTKSLMHESIKNHGVFCIRYPRDCVERKNYESLDIKFGDWIKEVSTESKTCIISLGPIIEKLKLVIKDNNLKVDVYNAIYQKPLPSDLLASIAKTYDKIIIHDAYSIKQGFATYAAIELVEKGFKGELIIKAIPNIFVREATISEQMKQTGVSVEDVINLI